MKKAWLVCSLLGAASVWVACHSSGPQGLKCRFMEGADLVAAEDVGISPNRATHVEYYNLHEPYDQVWGEAQSELCQDDGWNLGSRSQQCQSFNFQRQETVVLARGRLDSSENIIDGTDGTDSFVEVRTVR